jgi:hypothetical protein
MNEPAAWFYQYPGETGIFMCADAEAMKGIEGKGYILTPLYTHPAKTLTDEEIVDIIQRLTAKWTDEFKNYENDSDEPEENKLRDDVFAILKKAQEK